MDPTTRVRLRDARGLLRRWLTPGAIGEGADVGGGHVFKSVDAGETFTDISGDPARHPRELRARAQRADLLVGTDLGVFISSRHPRRGVRAAGHGTAGGARALARAQAQGGGDGAGHADRRHAGSRRVPATCSRTRPRRARSSAAALTGGEGAGGAGRGLKLSFKRSVRKPVRSTSSSSRSAAGSWASDSSRASRTPRRRSAGTGARTVAGQKVARRHLHGALPPEGLQRADRQPPHRPGPQEGPLRQAPAALRRARAAR